MWVCTTWFVKQGLCGSSGFALLGSRKSKVTHIFCWPCQWKILLVYIHLGSECTAIRHPTLLLTMCQCGVIVVWTTLCSQRTLFSQVALPWLHLTSRCWLFCCCWDHQTPLCHHHQNATTTNTPNQPPSDKASCQAIPSQPPLNSCTVNSINILCTYMMYLSLIHIWRCRRITGCRSRWSPYH